MSDVDGRSIGAIGARFTRDRTGHRPGILRAYNGHVAGVNGGQSWSQPVTSGHTKILAIKGFWADFQSTPNGIRTRAATLKGWCPRPLDDGGLHCISPGDALVVGLPGFEPGTSASRTQRATKLRYSPQRVTSQPANPVLGVEDLNNGLDDRRHSSTGL